MLFNGMGGSGAAKDADGWPMIGTIAGMGGLTSASVEEVELLYPLHIDFNEIETDSMGMGQWIGGAGLRTRFRPIAGHMEAVSFGEGSKNPPHGVNGGTRSAGGVPSPRWPAKHWSAKVSHGLAIRPAAAAGAIPLTAMQN